MSERLLELTEREGGRVWVEVRERAYPASPKGTCYTRPFTRPLARPPPRLAYTHLVFPPTALSTASTSSRKQWTGRPLQASTWEGGA